MKKTKKLRLPQWIIRNIRYERAEEDLGSMIVDTLILSLMLIVGYFIWFPFGYRYILMQILVAFIFVALMGLMLFWLRTQVELLQSMRKEVLKSIKNAKTVEEYDSYLPKAKRLGVVPKSKSQKSEQNQ